MSLVIYPEAGRILEVQSLETGAELVSWWPYRLDSPESAGGIGEASVPEGASPYKWRQTDDSIILSRCLPGELSFEKKITVPPDSLDFTVSITLTNTSECYHTHALTQSAFVSPGSGGACPGGKTGIINCHEKAFLKRPGKRPETVLYEVFEPVALERDDVEWAAFNDPVSGNLFCAILPEGHTRLRTHQHWELEWSHVVGLEPGGRYSGEFRYVVAGGIDRPFLVSEHFLAGFAGTAAALSEKATGKVAVYGLNPEAGGNELSVSVDGREVFGPKPLPAGREPIEIELGEWDRRRGAAISVDISGKFGELRLPPCRCKEIYEELEGLCADAAAGAEGKRISAAKAASVLAQKRIVDLNRDKGAAGLEAILEKCFFAAGTILDSPTEPTAFYTEAEKKTLRRLAGGLDMEKAAATAKEALRRTYDMSAPRFRDDDWSKSPFVAASAILEGALVLNVRSDEELLELLKERLRDFTALWAKYGQVRFETIHHGCILSSLIPAYKIASEGGWLTLEEEAEIQAMIFDLCGKIRRRGGVQFRLSNWHAMEKAALAWTGALFPYLGEAAEYMRLARDTFRWLLVHGTFADGGFWEMSPTYHWLTLMYLHHIAEAFGRSGEDFYNGDVCGRRLSEMTDYLKKIAAPVGALPAFEDSGNAGRGMPAEVLLSIAKRLQDGELFYQATAAFKRATYMRPGREAGAWNLFVPLAPPEQHPPNRGSEVLVPSGKLILRSSCRTLTFIFDFGPHGGWHGHSDKLSFEAFSRDAVIIPDAGSYKYEDALQWDWFKTACAHNTVTLGDADRIECGGQLLYFQEGRGFVTAGMKAAINERVTHRREVTLSDRTLLVDDFVENAPRGEMLVWRMNSYEPVEFDGERAGFARGGIKVAVTPVTEDVEVEIAEVELLGEEISTTQEYVTGWQIRISKAITCDSERMVVRIDFSW